MFCVIQELERKKPNQHGHYRELEAYSYKINGRPKYAHRYTGERFERPIRTAYKVSIHESKRVGGVVTKRQYPVTTVGYYALVECGIWDCVLPGKVKAIAAALDVPEESLWGLIHAKIDPLQERIQAEFAETPEHKTRSEHEKILEKYRTLKAIFGAQYGIPPDYYDYCYDIFGNVVNQTYLDEIMAAGRRQEQAQSSYQKTTGSNYSGYSELFGTTSGAYSDEDKGRLRQFYKALAKIFHPDKNLGIDTSADMALLNRLREDWGI